MKIYFLLFVFLALACGKSDSQGTAETEKTGAPPGYKSIHESQLEQAKMASKDSLSNRFVVETGLDVLVSRNFDILQGQRVGVITNHTGRSKDGRHIVDLLNGADGVELVAIFGPEHGVRGVEPDGETIESKVDPATGIPIYSLYGNTRQPTADMLKGLDVLVFDIQDVGARFYTYIYTMALAMQAAAEHGKKFVVLDRPNPITGEMVEGPMLEKGYESFVGMFPMPVRHGMTVGELAQMFKREGWINGSDSLDLQVIKMTGWRRSAWYDETDLPWIAPSPSMRTLATATVYPGTCFLEGTNATEGRGTDKPFEKIGAPWLDAQKLADALNKLSLSGVKFEPISFTPVAMLPSVPRPKYKDEACGGIFVKVMDREIFEPVNTGVAIIWATHELYPDHFDWRGTINRLYGSDRLRKGIDAGKSFKELAAMDTDGLESFLATRSKYLLYD